MGTCSYVLTGTEQGMTETFGTTCHGAVSMNCLSAGLSPASVSRSQGLSVSLHVSVSGSSSLSSKVPQEPGLPGRPGQTGRHGHRHPSGFTQTGHGGGEETVI